MSFDFSCSFMMLNYIYILNCDSFALLWGPTNHLKHLMSAQRLPFTTAYFGSMFATLYFSIWVCFVFALFTTHTHTHTHTEHIQALSARNRFTLNCISLSKQCFDISAASYHHAVITNDVVAGDIIDLISFGELNVLSQFFSPVILRLWVSWRHSSICMFTEIINSWVCCFIQRWCERWYHISLVLCQIKSMWTC